MGLQWLELRLVRVREFRWLGLELRLVGVIVVRVKVS